MALKGHSARDASHEVGSTSQAWEPIVTGDVNGGDKNTCVVFMMSLALSLVLYLDMCNNPHNSLGKYVLFSPHFAGETQNGLIICPKSHSKLMAKLGLELRQ